MEIINVPERQREMVKQWLRDLKDDADRKYLVGFLWGLSAMGIQIYPNNASGSSSSQVADYILDGWNGEIIFES